MDIVTFGESLFRTATTKGERLASTNNLNFYLGGAELNLAANLKSLGISASWVSAVPAGMTGEFILEKIMKLGVDISHCTIATSPQVGWYLMDSGAGPRPDVVLHRNASAMSLEKSFSFDWKKILFNSKVFHTSGITCGLSHVLTDEIEKAMTAARAQNTLVSYDFNYRKNIWSIEEFVIRQKDLIPNIDILFCSHSDLKLFFGDDYEKNNFEKVFSKNHLQFLVLSQRSDNNSAYGVEIITREKNYKSQFFPVQSIDRIGVGDSAAAGFFKIFLKNRDLEQAANWAALTGAMKYGICGDMALLQEKDVERALQSTHSGILR